MSQPTHRELYVRAVVPDYAKDHFEEQAYSPWFLAHADHDRLDNTAIQGQYDLWVRTAPVAADTTDLMEFFAWLEGREGYRVLNSACDNYCLLVTATSVEHHNSDDFITAKRATSAPQPPRPPQQFDVLPGQLTVTVREWDASVQAYSSGELSSELHCDVPTDDAAEATTAALQNAALDGMESLLLALACAGCQVDTPVFREAVQTTLDKIAQVFD